MDHSKPNPLETSRDGGKPSPKRPGRPKAEPLTVGWRELAELPEWEIPSILAKIDTGARTSALHVENLVETGENRLRFDVVIRERPEHVVQTVEADLVRWTRVRPSSGEGQMRPVVRTRLCLGPWEREIEISLVRRPGMLCRMLIGRRAMKGLRVHPGKRYLVSTPPTSAPRPSRQRSTS